MNREPARFLKRPVMIEAFEYTATEDGTVGNVSDIIGWMLRSNPHVIWDYECKGYLVPDLDPQEQQKRGNVPPPRECDPDAGHTFYIATLEGRMEVSNGDYVIRGVQGEFYPCKPDIFAATYDFHSLVTDAPFEQV